MKKVLNQRVRVKEIDEEQVPQYLVEFGIVKRPVPRLKDVKVLKELDWLSFVNSLVEYKCKKDERVKLFLKKDLLRGYNPRLNPHGIVAKPPGAGITEYYRQHCVHIGKVTKNSLVGYAKSPEEIYKGIIDGEDKTIALDQIESQDAKDIFGYLFDVAEQGITTVSSGAVKFNVQSNAKFTFISNIISDDPARSFRYLLDNIAVNLPAFLKRTAIILFASDIEPVREKLTTDFTIWKLRSSLFRAVEEFACKKLYDYHYDKEVWKWSQEPLGDYEKEIVEIVSSLSDEKMKLAFEEHAKGAQPRIRGAGLDMALAEKLDEIALNNRLDLKTDILKPAEEYAYQYANMNKESISKIADRWEKERERLRKDIYDMLPDYLKEIVSAVEQYRSLMGELLFQSIDAKELGNYYKPQHYQYFSQVLNLIKQSKKCIERYNYYLRTYYGFEMTKENDIIYIRFL